MDCHTTKTNRSSEKYLSIDECDTFVSFRNIKEKSALVDNAWFTTGSG